MTTQPLAQYWEPRRVRRSEVLAMIDALDPVEHDVEITHLSQEVLIPPLIAYVGYAAGFARTLGNPAVANRISRNGTGDQIVKAARRDLDTLTFFGLFMRNGYRSAEAQAVYDRVQAIHGQIGGVSNETQLHVLGMLIFEQERADEHYRLGLFHERDKEARFNFWAGVGRAMRLRDIPESRAEFLTWCDDYEARTFAPSEEATKSFKGQLSGISEYVPVPIRPVVRQLLIEAVQPEVRELLGFDESRPGRARVGRRLAQGLVKAHYARPLTLNRTWVTDFSRFGRNPDINRLGYQRKLAGTASE